MNNQYNIWTNTIDISSYIVIIGVKFCLLSLLITCNTFENMFHNLTCKWTRFQINSVGSEVVAAYSWASFSHTGSQLAPRDPAHKIIMGRAGNLQNRLHL